MAGFSCPQCGAPLPEGTSKCKFCGEVITAAPQQQVAPQVQYVQQPAPQIIIQQVPVQTQGDPAINPYWPIKSRISAGVLGILLGGLGIHKFYLGKAGLGILYLVFCWTFIPSVIGFIEGIIYLTQSDRAFSIKNQVRVE